MRKLLFQSLLQSPLTEAAPARDDATLAELSEGLERAARRRLGRSLSIRQVDAGSCNGCELEIHAAGPKCFDPIIVDGGCVGWRRAGLKDYLASWLVNPRNQGVLFGFGQFLQNTVR